MLLAALFRSSLALQNIFMAGECLQAVIIFVFLAVSVQHSPGI
jgi:hypothetical protein